MTGLVRRTGAWLCFSLAAVIAPTAAHAALSITPLTWDIIGLDSNSPAIGPRHFPVGARVCSTVATTNVAVDFQWDSPNANIGLRAGSLSTLTFASLPASGCSDAYFEAEINPVAAAFGTTRRYHIAATDGTGTASTPTPRELYVEHLVSQNRNAILNVRYGPTPLSLSTVAPGGSMNLAVGNTYSIELTGSTATQGYEQLQGFINFSNAIFQVLAVSTTYSTNTSAYVSSPSDKLYADACGWEPDPNSPDYRSCVGIPGKTGGNSIVTLYTVRIVSGSGPQALNALLYDFSGSSYHYNADFGVGGRIANIIDPATAGISKSFSPNPATLNGVSALTITLTNPNGGELGGYSVVDNLPANMFIATPANATTSGCGTPTLVATAGTQVINFSNGTVAGNGTCTIKVDVTTTATGSFVNTTQNLFVGAIDTGRTGTATLVVNNAPPPGTGICGLTLARWNFATGFSLTAPLPTVANVPVSAAPGAGIAPNAQTTLTADGTSAWGSNGAIDTSAALVTANDDYFEFAIDTTGLTQVYLNFDAQRRSANGPQGVAVYWGTTNARPEAGTSIFNNATALPTQNSTVSFGAGNSIGVTSGLNPSGNTYFRIYFFNAGNGNPGSDPVIDDVLFTGCGTGAKPTIAKSFTPDPIAVGGISTLTFTLTNPNSVALTAARFTDNLPSGTEVAATPAASTTCGGSPTWAPAAASTALVFGTPAGATLPASGSCTVSVNVTATAAGTRTNISGLLSTAETGTSTTSIATDTLTAIAPPAIAKQFAPNTILAGGVSTLTFAISNPNPGNAISGVAFSDNLPNVPGVMRVAAIPNATTAGCGTPVYAPVAAATSIAFSGGSIAAGGTCFVTVDVTAPSVGNYNNVSGSVSHIVNAAVITGNTASASLAVTPPNPSISLLKQVGPTAAGPWSGFRAVNLPASVFYRFIIENTDDVPLSPVSISDPTVPSAAGCTWPSSLPVAAPANDNHIATCVVGPVTATAGTVVNTATATGFFSGNPVTATSTARYGDASLALTKSASPATYTAVGNVITYTFVVTNDGSATLSGPISVLDDQTVNETCPALNTIGDLDNFFDPGEQITCSATYTITAADITNGSVVNIASATNGTTTSPNATATVNLIGPRLTLTKTASPSPFVAGLPASYTINVINNGTASSSGDIVVTDNLPAGITLTSASGTNWSCVGVSTLTCTFTGTLTAAPAAGSSTTLTLTVNVDASATTGNNTAAGSGGNDPTCPAAAHCTDTVLVGIVAPVLTTTKTGILDNAVIPPSNQSDPGDTIAYTITVANSGAGPAAGVNIADPLITLTCTIGGSPVVLPTTLNAGASLICTGTYTLTAADVTAGSVTNTATTSGTNVCNPATAGSTCSGTDVKPLALTPVLSTAKTGVLDNTVVAPGDQSNPGDTIAYTITVVNSGNGDATGVSIADPLITPSCTIGGSPVVLPTTLSAGASLICTGTYTLTAADVTAGSVTNTATTSGTNVCNPATAGSTCSGTDVKPLALTPVLSTAKTGVLDNTVVAPGDQSNPGDTIAYTITVVNSGNGDATGVSIADPLITPSCTIGGSPVVLPTTLSAGASLICTGTYTLTAADVTAGSVTNTATTSGTNVCNPVTAGSTCSGTDVKPLALTPVLSTAKTGVLDNTVVAPGDQSNPGDTIAYTITVVNSGNGDATGVSIADPLITPSCTIGGSPVVLPTTLSAGASLICTGTYTLVASDITAGSVTNAATTSANNICNPTTPGSTCGDVEITPLGVVPNLTVDKMHTGNFTQGQTGAQFTLLVSNVGSGPTSAAVSITDTLPAGLVATNISGTGWTCVLASLTCTRSDVLAAGASYPPITLVVDVAANAPASLVNSATVSGGGDTTPNNNTDTDPVNVNPLLLPDLTIVKTHSGSFVRGQPGGVYSLLVSNVSTVASSGLVTVVDTLPAGLTATAISGAGWTCTLVSLSCTRSDALAAGAAFPAITISVTVSATAAENLVNNASVSGGGDTNPNNNATSVTTPVGNGQPPTPVQPVPTTSPWTLLLLALSLIVLARSSRRRLGSRDSGDF